MKAMWPFSRPVEQLDQDIHAELQHVKVVIAQVKDLQSRYSPPFYQEGQAEIREKYDAVLESLEKLRAELVKYDVQHYEVDAG